MLTSNSEIPRERGSPTVARFGETHWSVILSAMDRQRPVDAADALDHPAAAPARAAASAASWLRCWR